ncbi:MAG: class I SAM-dependent methyltransferase [Acidobacteriota bacterium]|nr:class I SAM-dependent methyltransferase [Acidobacteriota bacterium]
MIWIKRAMELLYWVTTKMKDPQLSSAHYVQFYTTHFGLDASFYSGKRILDIGCGPRGSLEWASNATERVGLDPLADSYLRLGASRHSMRYIAGHAENIPFPDGHFDVICSFNSLDHVDDLDRVIAEIPRVLKAGGLFLLLTDVNHSPTLTEPITYSWDILERFQPAFDLLDVRRYEKSKPGMYESIRAGVTYDDANPAKRYGILSAKLGRRPLAPAE